MTYTANGPADNTRPVSSAIRREFKLIQDEFDKLPVRNNHNDQMVFVKADASGLEALDAAAVKRKLTYGDTVFAYKTADESRADPAYTDDSDLTVNLSTGTHAVSIGALLIAETTPDNRAVQFNLSFSGTATIIYGHALGVGDVISNETGWLGNLNSTDVRHRAVEATIVVTAVGTLNCQWKVTQPNHSVILKKYSWVAARKWS